MEKDGWLYIMASRYRGGMNVGVTAYWLWHLPDLPLKKYVFLEQVQKLD